MFSLSRLIDVLTTGNKARVAMEVAIVQGYVKDPDRMRAYYDANREVLEEWFRETDVEEVIEEIRSSSKSQSVEQATKDSSSVAVPAVGAVAGALITYSFTR